ncbi:MAG TPA: phytanoyl-CoA dioxygenase family protein [Rhizomicrobium sp.]|nr:phytanoyl-CoA dioxygenase family protein [Rhizomicrobium sp.]
MSAFDAGTHHDALRRDGFTIIRDFADAATRAEIRAAVAPHLGAHRGRNAFEGYRTERVYTLVARGRVFERLAADERLLALIGRVLQPDFLLSAAQAILIHPGEAEQALHHDDNFYRVPRPRSALGVSMILAVDDFTPDNGATTIVPGSHAWGAPGPEQFAKAQREKRPAVMPAGSALVFPGTFIHGGGANRSAHPRLAVTFQYCEGWLRQQENFFLAVPRDVVRSMPPRLQALLGYSIWPPFMGMVTAHHPARTLDDDFVTPVAAEPRS